MTGKTREGFLYGLAAYGWWGLVPLYFRWLKDDVSPSEMLAHRVVWSLGFLAVILSASGRWGEIARALKTPSLVGPLTLSALLVALNWLVYIFSVSAEKIVQASLGYYITPLMSVLLGLAFFRERLRPLQWVALALACVGVGYLTQASGEFPVIALTLATSFSIYSAVRKKVPVDGLTGLSVETIVLTPVALGYLILLDRRGELAFSVYDGPLVWKLMLSGVVTAIPLLCFGQAARRLPLSTLGFLQYFSPSIQLLVAVYLFHEPVPGGGWGSFLIIWAALGLFTVDSVRTYRRAARLRAEPAA